MKLTHLTLKHKILLMLFWEIGALLLLFFVSQFFMVRNNSLLEQIEGNFVPALELGRDMEQMLTELQRGMQDAVAATDQDRLTSIDTVYNEFLTLLEQSSTNPFFEEQKLRQLKAEFQSYYVLARKTSLTLIEGQSLDEQLIDTLEVMRARYNFLKTQLQSKTVTAKEEVSLSFSEALKNSGRSAMLMNIIIIVSTLVFGSLSFLLSRAITGPLHNLMHATNRIAQGDLSQAITIRTSDELALLGNAMERMRSELQQFYQRLEHLVSERTQALQESEARFRQVISSINDHIYIGELTEDSRWLTRYHSPNIETLTGYPLEQFMKDSYLWPSLIHQDDAMAVNTQLTRFFNKQNSEAEYRIRRKDGTFIWVRDNGRVEEDPRSEHRLVYGVVSDITHRKKEEERQQLLQNKLRQAQRLEAIGKLAGGTAHEFNNILAIMLGVIELVISQLSEDNPATAKLEQAYKTGERGRDLVKEILIFSRSSQQKVQPVHLAPILQDAINMMQSIVPPTVELRYNFTPTTQPVLANPLQIEQIIINLCKNAIQAMQGQQGVIEIDLDNNEQTTISEKDRDVSVPQYIRLTVKDNGSGMPSDIKEHIFDPFFTTKEVGQGTGLGLSVVHGIIQQYGGEIRVDSEPGQGTMFEILFPVAHETMPQENPEKAVSNQAPDPPQRLSVKEHILIIDNDSKNTRLPVMALEKLGYAVTVVDDGNTALNRFRHHPEHFHLVMIDLTLHEKEGVQICREIVGIRSDLPLLIYTDTHTSFNSKDFGEIGFTKFLRKPLKVRQLIQTVREMLLLSQKK